MAGVVAPNRDENAAEVDEEFAPSIMISSVFASGAEISAATCRWWIKSVRSQSTKNVSRTYLWKRFKGAGQNGGIPVQFIDGCF